MDPEPDMLAAAEAMAQAAGVTVQLQQGGSPDLRRRWDPSRW